MSRVRFRFQLLLLKKKKKKLWCGRAPPYDLQRGRGNRAGRSFRRQRSRGLGTRRWWMCCRSLGRKFPPSDAHDSRSHGFSSEGFRGSRVGGLLSSPDLRRGRLWGGKWKDRLCGPSANGCKSVSDLSDQGRFVDLGSEVVSLPPNDAIDVFRIHTAST